MEEAVETRVQYVLYETHLQKGGTMPVQSGSRAWGPRRTYGRQKIPQSRKIYQSSFPRRIKLADIKEGHHTGKCEVGHNHWRTVLKGCGGLIRWASMHACPQCGYGKRPVTISIYTKLNTEPGPTTGLGRREVSTKFALCERPVTQAVNKRTPGFRPLSVCRQ